MRDSLWNVLHRLHDNVKHQNAYWVTDPLWEESTGRRRVDAPNKRASNASFGVFIDTSLKRSNKQ